VKRRAIVLAGALAVVAAALLFVAVVGHRPLSYITRDPQATTLERWFLGFFSNVGSALWWATVGIASITGSVLVAHTATAAPEPGRRDDGGWFMLGVAAFSAVLAIDDMFGVHDVWGFQAGIPEWPFFAGYALLAVAVLGRFRREVERTWLAPLFLAVSFYVFSTLVDWLSGHSGSDVRYLGEDGVKLLAIVCWLAWVAHSAFVRLRAAAGTPHGTPDALPYD
jgi:hypothetical protein